MIKTIRRPLSVVVGFLALGGVGTAVTHYLYEPYNPGFLKYPTIVALHVILGGFYMALAPFQFARMIRSRHLGYHRWAGRVLVSIGLLIGTTGVLWGCRTWKRDDDPARVAREDQRGTYRRVQAL